MNKSYFFINIFFSFILLSTVATGRDAFLVFAQMSLPADEILDADGSAQSPIPQNKGPIVLDILDLKNMDVLDVLKLISQKSGFNIVAGQNVTGRVTVYLKDIEVEEALRIIIEAYGWAYVREVNTIKVITAKDFEAKYGYKFGHDIQTKIKQLLFAKATDVAGLLNQIKSESGKIIADEKSNSLVLMDISKKLAEMEKIVEEIDVPITTEIFDLSYAKASDITTTISEILTPTIGKMKHDERSNKVVVTDTPTKIKEITKIIAAFDEQDKEVLIESKIIQILLSDEYKWGVDWEGIVANYHKLDIASDFDLLSSSDKKGKISIGTLSEDDYSALLEALDAVGDTKILSSPRIAVINNKEAKILVGSTEPYVTTTTTTPESGATITAESVNFIEVGVKLYVTPTIHDDGFITMKIKPEVSSVTSTLTTSNKNTIPVVETSEAETTVTVKDGVTIVIGGLIKDEKKSSSKKIPLLGDIPILGYAFKNETDLTKKTEVVIFLTPKIVTGEVDENRTFSTIME